MSEEKQINYKDTLNLPRTDFPMRAKLNVREPGIYQKWLDFELDKKILEGRDPAKRYVLHDGPPYANGAIHMGHALNKILKDIVVRYKTMKGYHSHYVPGWDCHGLPIEQKVRQKLGSKIRDKSVVEIRRLCQEYATKWVKVQGEEFQRLGVGGDFENPYLTLNPQYEAGILKAFRGLVENRLVYRGRKPVYWCCSCGTALADAEVEYEDHESHSIYVRFPILNPEAVPGLAETGEAKIVIWTTTPWTLPANVAVSLHPDLPYVAARIKDTGEVFLLAEGLLQQFLGAAGYEDAEVLERWKGEELKGLECAHPLLDKKSTVIHGRHVTLEQGTGCVHTAPGHGYEDYLMLLEHDLPMVMPVDGMGRFTEEFPLMEGVKVWKANDGIVEKLWEDGLLVADGKVRHSYPHCWRCHKPIIFRATRQWFMSVDAENLRNRCLEAIDQVNWIPKWGRERIYNMVTMRPDWCLSRQRKWGVPIPAVTCSDCGEVILDLAIIDKFIEQTAEKGTDSWFADPAESVIPEGFECPECGGSSFEKNTDTLDVWFDSGASHVAVCERIEDLGSPADLYLEGSDQHRGWFQSSLLAAMGARNHPPYKSVMTHGFVLDARGEAMSKSKGNVIPPLKVIEKMGADVLRLWVASEDYREDVRISQEILDRISDAYRRIRNTFRFLLGNLGDFDPEKDAVVYEELPELDRWALHRLANLALRVEKAYENFEFHKVYHFVHGFCVTELSAVYLDIVKDRLYCEGGPSPERRAAQTVLYETARTLAPLLAPVLPFTMEEVYQSLEKASGASELNPIMEDAPLSKSVHQTLFPEPPARWTDEALSEKWERLLKIREIVVKSLEEARREKKIGHSLDAKVELKVGDEKLAEFLKKYADFMADFCIVSHMDIVPAQEAAEEAGGERPDVQVAVEKAPWEKCARCWKRHSGVGENADFAGSCPRCAGVLEKYGRTEAGT